MSNRNMAVIPPSSLHGLRAGWMLIVLGAVLLLSSRLGMAQTLEGASGPVRIAVRAESQVPGSHFTLADVADLSGGDAQVSQQLGRTSLGRSPAPGRNMRLHESYLKNRLARSVAAGNFELIVAPGAQVTRAAQVISGPEIGEIVLAHVKKTLPPGGEVRHQVMGDIREARLPLGNLVWNIKALGKPMATGGARTYRVQALVDGQAAWNATIRIQEEVFQDVVVATRPIGRGELLSEEDLVLERRQVKGRKAGSYLTNMASILGKPAVRSIAANEWIRPDMVHEPVSISEGGRVVLLFEGPGIRFQSVGVALVAGKQGDFIPVRNLQSGRIVYGIVRPNEVVQVN